jgi:hypothetical protein
LGKEWREDLNTLELLLLRQWLKPFEDSLSLDKEFIKEAQETRLKIDKVLWATYISNKTPWGEVKDKQIIIDENFDKTLEEIFGR